MFLNVIGVGAETFVFNSNRVVILEILVVQERTN